VSQRTKPPLTLKRRAAADLKRRTHPREAKQFFFQAPAGFTCREQRPRQLRHAARVPAALEQQTAETRLGARGGFAAKVVEAQHALFHDQAPPIPARAQIHSLHDREYCKKMYPLTKLDTRRDTKLDTRRHTRRRAEQSREFFACVARNLLEPCPLPAHQGSGVRDPQHVP